MYSITGTKYKNDYKLINNDQLQKITGFMMHSRGKTFNIKGSKIKNIMITNKKLGHNIVSKKVMIKYQKLIGMLTDLLIEDDDTGDSYREALNQIEKFRLEIKNKYREFLLQKELEMMSKQLVALQKEAKNKFIELQNNYLEMADKRDRRSK